MVSIASGEEASDHAPVQIDTLELNCVFIIEFNFGIRHKTPNLK